jgi:predicted GIY-YIG superfamily endonuclease
MVRRKSSDENVHYGGNPKEGCKRSWPWLLRQMPLLFTKLMEMDPVSLSSSSLPRKRGVYLISEKGNNLYVGQAYRQGLRKRLEQHTKLTGRGGPQGSKPDPYTATLALHLFRQERQAIYNRKDKHGKFKYHSLRKLSRHRMAMKYVERVRNMVVRYVEIEEPDTQYLFEFYVAKLLKTPYNNFEAH